MEKRRINYRLLAVGVIVAAVIVVELMARATNEELLEIGYAEFAKTLTEHGYPPEFDRSQCEIIAEENEQDVTSFFLCRTSVPEGTFHFDIAFDQYGNSIYSENEVRK